jgi:nucleoside-diphosphate-sugar epimerase
MERPGDRVNPAYNGGVGANDVILVTGASGFIGGAVARALLARGSRVRVLARTGADVADLERRGAFVARGDLTDRPSMSLAVEGASAVVHAAGAIGAQVDRETADRVNAAGTRNALTAAADAGATRFVHLSSVIVYGLAEGTYAEDAPLARVGDPYGDSKVAAEEACVAAPLETVRLRPTLVYGPGDRGFLPFVANLVATGKAVILGDGEARAQMVHVDDLVAAVLASVDRPEAANQAFNVDGPDALSYRELFEQVAIALGRPPPRRRVPAGVARALGWAGEVAARAGLVRSPPLTRAAVDLFTRTRGYPTDKARRVLGFAAKTQIAVGLPGALEALA